MDERTICGMGKTRGEAGLGGGKKSNVVLWMSHSSGGGKCADGEGWALYKGMEKYLLTLSPGLFK